LGAASAKKASYPALPAGALAQPARTLSARPASSGWDQLPGLPGLCGMRSSPVIAVDVEKGFEMFMVVGCLFESAR
jgi:hypothetical protein